MPELPEVETVRRGLEPVMCGCRITRLELRRRDLRFPFPPDFADRVEGRMITSLGRRSKYLLATLDNGDVLLMHLGMTGRFDISRESTSSTSKRPGEFHHKHGGIPAHDHVIFHLESGDRVTYNDVRRFGFMVLMSGPEREQHPLLRDLGVEPLGNAFSAEYVAERAHGRKTDLKAFLLDQRHIAGLGNIYVCEALYRSRLGIKRRASVLATRSGRPTEAAHRLVREIRAVLEEALAAGGSTLRDYRHADGALGYFQHAFNVYGREGEPCLAPGCSGLIHRIVQAGRSTFHCPKCQR